MTATTAAEAPPSARTVAVMRGNRSRDTEPELALRRALHGRGLRYRVHVRPVAKLRRTADIVFPRRKLAVFVQAALDRLPTAFSRRQASLSNRSANKKIAEQHCSR